MTKFIRLLEFFWQKYPYRFITTLFFVFFLITGGSSIVTLSFVDGDIKVTSETCQVLLDEQREEFEKTVAFVEKEKETLNTEAVHLKSEAEKYLEIISEQKQMIEKLEKINQEQQKQIDLLLKKDKTDPFWNIVGA